MNSILGGIVNDSILGGIVNDSILGGIVNESIIGGIFNESILGGIVNEFNIASLTFRIFVHLQAIVLSWYLMPFCLSAMNVVR